MTPACLDIEGIAHGYGDRTVLRDISFEVAPSDVVCLLGRSGCGKTTLLRLIAGLERPRAGRIAVNGRDLTSAEIFVSPDKRGVGLMFQDYALFPHLSALENVKFGLQTPDVDPLDLLDRVGLKAAAHRYPHTFSAGEQQRVALVRALASRPAVLLMDEPFSNLDAGTRETVRDMTLALLAETCTAAVVVTHDPTEAMAMADRIVLMKDGGIEQIGTPEAIYKTPATFYTAAYFSDLNPVDVAGHRAYIRPQHLRISGDGLGLSARITAMSYLGESTALTLADTATSLPLKANVADARGLAVGSEVRLTYAENDLLFFDTPPPLTAPMGDTR